MVSTHECQTELRSLQERLKMLPLNMLSSLLVTVLVSSPWTGQLRQQILIFLQFWRLEVQGQGAAGLFSGQASLSLQTAVPTVSSHGLFSGYIYPWCLFLFS